MTVAFKTTWEATTLDETIKISVNPTYSSEGNFTV